MSTKYAVSFFLLTIVCSAGFTNGFNSERVQSEDHTKRVKVLEQRDVRGRRARSPDLSSDAQDIFSSNRVRKSNTRNDYYAAFQTQQQQSLSSRQFQGQGFPSVPHAHYGNPGVLHSTLVPNGAQINNFYSPYGISPANSSSWQQQGRHPYVPVFLISIQLYPSNTQAPIRPTGELPSTDSMTDVSVDSRFGESEDQRPKTATGISLKVATPPRRPSRPIPEIQRNPSQSSFLASDEGSNIRQQAYSPPLPQRPQATVESAPTDILRGPNSINTQGSQVGANVTPCLWAIVSCCQSYKFNPTEQENCFDRSGCSGAFFEANPCNGELARTAEKTAQNFYNSG